MPSSRTLLSRYLSSTSLLASIALSGGCPSDGASCGPEDAPATGLVATAGTDTLTFGNLSSLSGNDCPDPAAPGGVVSLSIEGTLAGGGGLITFCIPRPDLLADGRALGATSNMGEMRLVDFTGTANGCTFARDPAKPPTGTGIATGICKNGTDPAGFALEITGTIHAKRTCGATVEDVALAVSGKVAVTSRD